MFKKFVIILILGIFLSSCGGAFKPKKVDTRETPINAQERARKNVEEGRGTSLGGLLGNRGNTTFEFSTSNPMWRASLETLDFLPLSTVNYSGGLIITDWYSDQNSNESIKISIRFLSNEISPTNLKIIVHQKNCQSTGLNCKTILLENSKIQSELLSTIIRKAALLEKETKKSKKR